MELGIPGRTVAAKPVVIHVVDDRITAVNVRLVRVPFSQQLNKYL